MVSNPAYTTASSSVNNGGSTRWMSPERLHPKLFDFKDGRPTDASDCYALGMTILEVLSGRVPYYLLQNNTVILMVMRGERPERPERPWFTDDLWETLEECWSEQPKDRPTIGAILERLGRLATTWRPLPPGLEDDDGVADDESASTVSRYREFWYIVLNLELRPHRRFNPTGIPRTRCQRCGRRTSVT